MLDVLGQMTALLFCGMGWRWLRPLGIDADRMRQAIAGLVFVLLLPALVLDVLWKAELGTDSLWIALIATLCLLFPLGVGLLLYRRFGLPAATLGALLLAIAWPNSTYLGLPVLEQTLGSWARGVAIQYDLFACTPLLLTLGVVISRHYGDADKGEPIWQAMVKVPPLWAALVGIGLNLAEVPPNPWLDGVLGKLGISVPTLMLLAVGMGLRWDTLRPRQMVLLIPVLLVQLIVTPLFAWLLTQLTGFTPELRAAVVLEAAMPTMVLGIVFCDRYGLDSPLYASAVTLSTLVCLATLPLWFGWLM